MPSDKPGEPWLSFLNDIDRSLTQRTDVHCLGGFAITQVYGCERATVDIDVLSVIPTSTAGTIADAAGKVSGLRNKHGVYLDVVTVTTVPEDYDTRLIPIFPDCWTHLRMFVLEPHDLALSKLERNDRKDRVDVDYPVRQGLIQPEILRARYYQELRPYLIGSESWRDQTLQLWLEAFFPPPPESA